MLTGLIAAGAAASALTAVLALGKLLGLPKLRKQLQHFLTDWLGEDARPGRDAVPSIPARIASLEDSHAALNDRVRDSDHKLRSDLTVQLGSIQTTLRERSSQTADVLDKIEKLGDRVTDHRRRNEDQIGLLQQAVDSLIVRTDRADERMARIETNSERRASDPQPAGTEEEPPPVSPGYDQ